MIYSAGELGFLAKDWDRSKFQIHFEQFQLFSDHEALDPLSRKTNQTNSTAVG